MRILMLDNEFPPLGGGTGVVNEHLLREFAKEDALWVDLVTSSRTPRDYETVSFSERITLYKVPVDNRNIHHSTNPELLRYAWRGLRLSRKLCRQHAYDLSFAFAGVPAGGISYALWKLNGLPYIVSLQGPDVPGFEARYNTIYPFLKPILQVIWRRAYTVLAISQQHRALALQTCPELPIPVIFNGIDTQVFFPATPRPADDPCNILCVGRLIERKGQQHLLQAFARLRAQQTQPGCLLTFVGTGDSESTLRKLAEDLGVAAFVRFLGFVPRERMPEIYRSAHIFVLPSQSEGMSIALLEAMASGLPVIVTDTGGTDELVSDGVNGLIVRWADVAALEQAIVRLQQNRALAWQLGDVSRSRAGQLSWENIAKEYLALFNELIRTTGRAL
jgi:glycosyltransferase involved in cell wall biosynthesis